jgi:hypothetical protein
LNPTGSQLLFSTYLGGIVGATFAGEVALDASGNIYVVGQTDSNFFPTINAFEPTETSLSTFTGSEGGFFSKIGSQTLPQTSPGSISTQTSVQTGTLTITFPNITGSTTHSQPTLSVSPLSSTTIANLSLSDNLGAYDISTTATFGASSSDPVTLCFQALTVNDPGTFSNLQILHVVNDIPQNVTTSYNFSTRTICGAVTSLSPFVLVKGSVDQLKDLVRTVNEADLRKGIQTSLDAKLQAAIGALNSAHSNDLTTSCNQMNAFLNNVQAQTGNAITLAEATTFSTGAKQIKATLGCVP